jgi:hypothetical protein
MPRSFAASLAAYSFISFSFSAASNYSKDYNYSNS